MHGFYANIEKETLENSIFRNVLYTAKYCQIVVMSILPKEEIGMEPIKKTIIFFRFERGADKAKLFSLRLYKVVRKSTNASDRHSLNINIH